MVCGLWTILACPLFVCIKFYWNAFTPVCFCTVRGHAPSAVAEVSSCGRGCAARKGQVLTAGSLVSLLDVGKQAERPFSSGSSCRPAAKARVPRRARLGLAAHVQTAPAPGGRLPREMGRPQGMGGSPGEGTGAGAFPPKLHTLASSGVERTPGRDLPPSSPVLAPPYQIHGRHRSCKPLSPCVLFGFHLSICSTGDKNILGSRLSQRKM